MVILSREFKPTLIPTMVTLLVLPILISLGFWQLDRAEQKRVILAAVSKKMNSGTLHKIPDKKAIVSSQYQHIILKGRFDSQHLIYIDNKIDHGKVGYQVVSPFLLNNSKTQVLVNLGWLAMGKTRQDLPVVTLPDSDIQISGRIKINIDQVYSLSDHSFDAVSWPLVVQWVSPPQLSTLLNTSFHPLMILLDKPKDKGYVYDKQFKREWKFISSSPDTHTSYAMQWFSLAFVLLLIFVGVNTRKI